MRSFLNVSPPWKKELRTRRSKQVTVRTSATRIWRAYARPGWRCWSITATPTPMPQTLPPLPPVSGNSGPWSTTRSMTTPAPTPPTPMTSPTAFRQTFGPPPRWTASPISSGPAIMSGRASAITASAFISTRPRGWPTPTVSSTKAGLKVWASALRRRPPGRSWTRP